ncbi:putative defense protein 3 [Amia ocellicauda]|uniref:putative defense protein 3 n=1 Tax=Amia ocellicauda TaxID=2972642 RepID=UPI003464C7E1
MNRMEVKSQTALFLLLLCWVVAILSYPTGAPVGQCVMMTPNHSNATLSNMSSPYSVTVNASTYVLGGIIKVYINSSVPYRGILLEARDVNTSAIVGTWKDLSTNTKTLNCGLGTNNAVTHCNNTDKSGLVYTWVAPAKNGPNKVVFMATVVKIRVEYWIELKSSELTLATTGAAFGLKSSAFVTLSLLSLGLVHFL